MKKNVIAIVAAVALVLLAVPTIAFANGMQQTWCPSGGVGSLAHHAMRAAGDSDAGATVGAAIATVRGEYVDRNNDGVCDNYGVGKGANGQGSCAGYADADGDGIGDNCANGQGSCPGYADADGNGVCDNYANGCGNGRGPGQNAAVPATSTPTAMASAITTARVTVAAITACAASESGRCACDRQETSRGR